MLRPAAHCSGRVLRLGNHCLTDSVLTRGNGVMQLAIIGCLSRLGPTNCLNRRMHCSDGGALKGLSPHALCKARASGCCSMKFTNTGPSLFIKVWVFVYLLEQLLSVSEPRNACVVLSFFHILGAVGFLTSACVPSYSAMRGHLHIVFCHGRSM